MNVLWSLLKLLKDILSCAPDSRSNSPSNRDLCRSRRRCYIDEHMGFIKFGSRVDVYLPLGTEVCVKMGQATVGNETVIAKLKIRKSPMANCITRHIPNAVTCCNLFSGCIASVMAFNEDYTLAISFIILGAVFDFFDGMLARLFKVSGPLGKELDSLADDITFGFAPSAIVFSLFKEVHYPDFLLPVADYMPYTAFLISVFSALRLGKFNYRPTSEQ